MIAQWSAFAAFLRCALAQFLLMAMTLETNRHWKSALQAKVSRKVYGMFCSRLISVSLAFFSLVVYSIWFRCGIPISSCGVLLHSFD